MLLAASGHVLLATGGISYHVIDTTFGVDLGTIVRPLNETARFRQWAVVPDPPRDQSKSRLSMRMALPRTIL